MMSRTQLEFRSSLLLALLILLSPGAQAQSESAKGSRPAAPHVAPPRQIGVVAKVSKSLEASRSTVPDSLLDTSPFAPKSAAQAVSPKAVAAVAGPGAGVHAVIAGSLGANFAGRRDPFRLPPPPAAGTAGMELRRAPLPGRHGLVIGQLKLLGVVRQHGRGSGDSQGAMTAVVTNASNIAYFLHPGDSLYDGRITAITADAAYFEQQYRDSDGHVQRRQVVKRLNSVSGEEQ